MPATAWVQNEIAEMHFSRKMSSPDPPDFELDVIRTTRITCTGTGYCTGKCAIRGESLNYFATFSPKSIKGLPHVLQLPVRLLRHRLVFVFLVPNHDHRPLSEKLDKTLSFAQSPPEVLRPRGGGKMMRQAKAASGEA